MLCFFFIKQNINLLAKLLNNRPKVSILYNYIGTERK